MVANKTDDAHHELGGYIAGGLPGRGGEVRDGVHDGFAGGFRPSRILGQVSRPLTTTTTRRRWRSGTGRDGGKSAMRSRLV